MADPENADRLRAEVRGLRRGMILLIALSCLAVAASTVAIILALRPKRAPEVLYGPQALYGPRTLVADRIVTTELHFAYDSDSGAARLFGSPLSKLAPERKGLDEARMSMRPGQIGMSFGAQLTMISPGDITLIGPGPSSMGMSADSLRRGLQLVAPDNWHSWPVDTLRPRRWGASRRQ